MIQAKDLIRAVVQKIERPAPWHVPLPYTPTPKKSCISPKYKAAIQLIDLISRAETAAAPGITQAPSYVYKPHKYLKRKR